MNAIKEYIESGILEAYILGIAAPEEQSEVEAMAINHAEIRAAMEAIGEDLERFACDNAEAPDPTNRPLLMATIDYNERIEQGEAPSFPPEARIRRAGYAPAP